MSDHVFSIGESMGAEELINDVPSVLEGTLFLPVCFLDPYELHLFLTALTKGAMLLGENRARAMEAVIRALPNIKPTCEGCMNCEELIDCLLTLFGEDGSFTELLSKEIAKSDATRVTGPRAVDEIRARMERYGERSDVSAGVGLEALCIACQRIVNALCDAELEMRDNVVDLAEVTALALSAGLEIAGALAGGPLGAAIATVFVMAINQGIGEFGEISEEILGDDDIRNEVACRMYRNLRGKDTNRTNFRNSLNGIEGDAAAISGAIAYLFQEESVYSAFLYYLDIVTDNTQDGYVACNCVIAGVCDECQYGDANYQMVYAETAKISFGNQTWGGTRIGAGVYSGTAWENFDGDIAVWLPEYYCIKYIEIQAFYGSSQSQNYTWNILDEGENVLGTTAYRSYPNDVNLRLTDVTLPTTYYSNSFVLRPTSYKPSGIARVRVWACVGG